MLWDKIFGSYATKKRIFVDEQIVCFMAVKLEIVILHPHNVGVEELWERYTDLIGLLTIDAKAHFAVVDEEDAERCGQCLAVADYVLPVKGCVSDFGGQALKAERLSGVLACDDEATARRFAEAVVASGRECSVIDGDKEKILKQIKVED